MSIRSIVNFNAALNLAVGVNVKLLPEGKLEIVYCILKRSKNMLSILEKRGEIQTVDGLYSFLKPFIEKGVRVHVNCIGRQVLNKIITGERHKDPSQEAKQWFPGIRREDFIFQQFTKPKFLALSLVRIEDIIKVNLFLDNSVTSFSMGVGVMEAIAPVTTQKTAILEGHAIQFDDHQIVSMETSEAPPTPEFDISGEMMPAQYILAYASAFILFLPLKDLVAEGLPEVIEEAPARYEAKQQIYKVAQWVIIVLLLTLPINAILFFWLDGNVAAMEASVNFKQGRSKSSEQNRNTIERLTSAYDAIGWEVNRLPLFYADQLAAAVPEEIQMNTMEAGILDESVLRRDRNYQFDATRIRVEGVSTDPAVLNDWIALLEKLAWVEGIREQNYRFDRRLGKGVFEFSILIKK